MDSHNVVQELPRASILLLIATVLWMVFLGFNLPNRKSKTGMLETPFLTSC